MSKTPRFEETALKRKHNGEDEGTSSHKRQKRSKKKSEHVASTDQTKETRKKVEGPKATGNKSMAAAAKVKKTKVKPTATTTETATEKYTPPRAPWTLGSARGGRFADRDPIFLQDNLITAIGDVVKVLDINTSIETAAFPPPHGSSIVSLDAVRSSGEDLVRVLYSNGVLVDWNWVTGSTNESQSAAKDIDLYRLTTIGEQAVGLYTTWNEKRCVILLDRTTLHTTKHRVLELKALADATVIAALCERAILMGQKETTGRYTWVELPWPRASTCFDIRQRRLDGKQTEFSLVVGQDDGEIHLYNNVSSVFASSTLPTPQLLHWHRHAVSAVKFSQDGGYLISGGTETVLVMWQLETGQRTYLPNLTSTIERIVVNQSGNRYALKMGDNSIMVLSTTELKPVANFAGLQASPNRQLVAVSHPITTSQVLLSVPSSQQARSRPFLQTFDIEAGKHVSRQALTRNNVTDLKDGPDGTPVLPPNVEHLAVSIDGKWLATIDNWTPPHRDLTYLATDEYMTDEEKSSREEVYLKFWRLDAKTNEWMLNSRIDYPHSYNDHPGTVFKLVSDTLRPGFVTVGEDSTVKTWRPQRKIRHGQVPIDEEEIEWACTTVVELERTEDRTDLELEVYSPANAALSISEDGSLLAVSVLNGRYQVVHLIDTATGEIRSSHDNITAPDLVELAFMDRYLVALSRRALRVWDVVEDKLHYAAQVPYSAVSFLAISRADNAIAVAVRAKNPDQSVITIYRFQPADMHCRVTTQQPVAALLSRPSGRGFEVIFGDATIRTLSATTTSQSVLAEEPFDTIVEDIEVRPLFVPETAMLSMPVEAQIEDDRSVVRPEQLAKVFEDGAALPTVREMFHAVAGLFGRKPKMM